MKKILVCAPTAAAKNYCAEDWLNNVQKFYYPDFEVALVDNTKDNGENAIYLSDLGKSLCLGYEFSVGMADVPEKYEKNIGLMERLAISHNHCRQLVLTGGFSHMLHLETDVFPPPDVIERLLDHQKPVISGLYYRDEGKSRKPMVQRYVFRGPNNMLAMNMSPSEDINFIDGSLKKVAHAGLGCLLVSAAVLKKVVFRSRVHVDAAPDTYFAEDCMRLGIPIYVDTSIICEHRNQAWGTFGVDYF